MEWDMDYMEWHMDHMDGKDIEWDTKESIVFLINSVDFQYFMVPQ